MLFAGGSLAGFALPAAAYGMADGIADGTAEGAALPAGLVLTPAVVEAGSPVLVRVAAPRDARLEGSWQDGAGQAYALHFFAAREGGGWYALAGMGVEDAVGTSTLKITIHGAEGETEQGGTRDIVASVTIHPAHYRTESITVPPKFVEPGPEERKIVAAAKEAKTRAFASSAGRPLWSGDFVAPVKAQSTDSFGTRRMYNGKLAGVHTGMDFRAASGTVVRAGNAGVVVLAQPLYYEGNCVIVDHGLGLMSLYMHFSRIDVKAGQKVAKGQALGLSGATGRVTGPHLHWAIRWEGAMLDPAKLLRLRLPEAR